MKKYSIVVSSILVLALLFSACSTIGKVAGDVVTQYHTLIEKYQKAQKMASNFRLCVDTAMGTIYTQATFLQNYQQADVQKAKVWRDALQSAGSKIADLLKNYKDANGNPIPVDQLDLGELSKVGALPNGVSSGLSLFVQAFQEAPLAAVSDAPVLAAMNTASEQYNKIDACGTDWNDAVEGYNVERNKIPGDVVGRIAEYLKVKELPESLPFYSGDYKGSVSQPNLPTPSK
jgi:hypothetical protein